MAQCNQQLQRALYWNIDRSLYEYSGLSSDDECNMMTVEKIHVPSCDVCMLIIGRKTNQHFLDAYHVVQTVSF